MKHVLMYLCICILFSGCGLSTRIKGGHSVYTGTTGAKIEMTQGDDAKMSSGFATKMQRTMDYIVPQGSKLVLDTPVQSKNADGVTPTNTSFILLSSNMPVRVMVSENVDLNHGAAQKNSYQDIAAKLSSMRPVQYVGIFLLLAGIATLVYPPLRLLIGSVTTSAVITGTGLALIILPIVIVGNEILILLIGLGVAIGYFFVYRYSKASTQSKVYKDFIDKNQNGIDDRNEKP